MSDVDEKRAAMLECVDAAEPWYVPALDALVAAVRAEEREACALAALDFGNASELGWAEQASLRIAARIRARQPARLTPRTCGRHPPDVCCERCEPG